jgi:site-specific DNA-methyltransferase (adenine-specific)
MYTLYNDDCFNILQGIKDDSVDLVICDLPYGQIAQKWDCKLDLGLLWSEYNRILREGGIVILFSSGTFTMELYNSNPKQYKYKLIWEKNVPSGMNSARYRPMKYYEEIMVFVKGKTKLATYNPIMKPRTESKFKYAYEAKYKHHCASNSHIPNESEKQDRIYDVDWVQPSDVLKFNVVPNKKKIHPTEKPIELLEWLIKTYSNEGDLIYEPFMGIGSTVLACIELNRNYVATEIDESYFNIAKNRIKESLNK